MSPPVVAVTDAAAVSRTVDALGEGGLVVLPTDTVYGLGCLPGVAGATAAVFAAKDRRGDVPVAVLCPCADSALGLADLGDDAVAERASRWAADHWPGPLTMVLPRRRDLDWDLGEPSTTVGVRVPDLAFVQAVTAAVGPIAVTSANRHGHPTPPEAIEAARALVGEVRLVVDGGPLEAAASTVVDVVSGRVLRAGPVVDLGL